MVLQDIKNELDNDMTNTNVVRLKPYATNDYFWSRDDCFHREDDEGGDYSYSNSELKVTREKMLNYLKVSGIIADIAAHTYQEKGVYDELNDEVDNYETTIDPQRFPDYYDKVKKLAQPFLDEYISERDGDETEYDSSPVSTPEATNEVNAATIPAELHFDINFDNIPIVTIEGKDYHFKAMRAGTPLQIVSFCLDNSANDRVRLSLLKKKMDAMGEPLNGVVNIRESLRNSLFGKSHELGVFITASPGSIMVKSRVLITKKHLKRIQIASESTQ